MTTTKRWSAFFAACWCLAACVFNEGEEIPKISPQIHEIFVEEKCLEKGTIWLEFYCWNYHEKIGIGDIVNGKVFLELDDGWLQSLRRSHEDGFFIIVVQASENVWYRSSKIFWSSVPENIEKAFEGMGRMEVHGHQKFLFLPGYVTRSIRLLKPDGMPLKNKKIPVAIAMPVENHCGWKGGLPLGKFETDGEGTFTVSAPLEDLLLDVRVINPTKDGGEVEIGTIIGKEQQLEVRKNWYSNEESPFVIVVKDAFGQTVRDISLQTNIRTWTGCGAWGGPLGKVDEKGLWKFSEPLEVLEYIKIGRISNEDWIELYELSKEEKMELAKNRQLTVVLH